MSLNLDEDQDFDSARDTPVDGLPPRGGYSSWDGNREATRYLSAETQISVPYAREVVRKVVDERFRALAPPYGVDVTVVAKWALSSLRLRAQRDRNLTFLLFAGILLFIILLIFCPWESFIAIVLTWILAWVVVAGEEINRLNRVGKDMLRGRFHPAAAPEPTVREQSDRLKMVSKRHTGNLIVFRGVKAFAGSGDRISEEHLLIDVSRGNKPALEDQKKAPKPSKFTNEDVHAAIVTAMGKIGLADARVEERLFVNGKHIQDNHVLLPDPKEPPVTSVDIGVIRKAALHPTPDARVYVCVEMPSWQGQLVVTLFARAVHIGGSLYIEWRFHVLRPVREYYQEVDLLWSEPRGQVIARSCWRSGLTTAPALLGAIPHLLMTYREAHASRRRDRNQEYAIDHGQVFDYGAFSSIREKARGVARQHYFLGRDEVMFVLLAQEKLIRAIDVFLDKKNVDTGQLKSQVKVIFEETNKYYSVHLGDVSNSSIAIGKNSQATGDSGTSKT